MKSLIRFISRKISKTVYSVIVSVQKILVKNNNKLLIRLNNEKDDEVWETFKKYLKTSIRFEGINARKNIREYAINLSLNNRNSGGRFYLEFGTWKGNSANYFSNFVDKFYVFDTFTGLPSEWEGTMPKGSFDLKGKLPKFRSNIEPVVGLVEDTLDGFLDKYKPEINFIHLDMDLYEPTKFTLLKIRPYLVSGAVILFDELYNYVNWQEGEYKALKEVFDEKEFRYKAFNLDGLQVCIQIV